MILIFTNFILSVAQDACEGIGAQAMKPLSVGFFQKIHNFSVWPREHREVGFP
jgi:hypothetical protein